jgi:AraC-like DNA-binding protein
MSDPVSRLGGAFLAMTAQPGPHPGHRHPELEFNLVVRGTARYLVGDRRYDLGPGSLAWFFPGQRHRMIDQSPDLRLWLGFFHQPVLRQAQLAGGYRRLLERDPAGHFCRQLRAQDAARLTTLLSEVAATLDDAVLLATGLAHLVAAAWAMHQRAPAVPASAELHPAVARAANALAGDDGADLAAVATRSGLSASRLRHLFRAQTGSSLTDYRNRQRLQRFIEARPRSRATLLDGALAAGFGSYAQFHRVFRRSIGVSPMEWLRKHH